MCKKCKLVQLDRNFNPKYLYSKDYGYRTGINKTMTEQKSNKKSSGFFIKKYVKLKNTIQELERKKETYILFGLSVELLEFSKYCNIKLEYGTIIETGGNKRNTRHKFLVFQICP